MLLPVYLSFALAALFYVLIPLFGALRRERSWAAFRAQVRGLSRLPEASYRDSLAGGPSDAAAGGAGAEGTAGLPPRLARLSGSIEGLEGESLVWLRGPSVSAVVDFSRSSLYTLLPGARRLPLSSAARAESIGRSPWARVRSLSEGTKLLVAGPLSIEGGRLRFAARPGQPLFALSYEGEETGLLDEVLAGARPGKPFLDPFTLGSWAAGIGALSILFLFWGRSAALPTVRFLEYLFALSPLLAFLPPGILFLFPARRRFRRFLSLSIEGELGKGGAGAAAWRSLALAALFAALAEATELSLAVLLWTLLRS